MAWRAVCDRCGLEYQSHELREEWTGLMVCSSCLDRRHPQQLLEAKDDRLDLPWVRPEPEAEFIVTVVGPSATSGTTLQFTFVGSPPPVAISAVPFLVSFVL